MTTGTACQHCGAPVNAGSRFCANCGADVSSEQGNVATRKFTSTQAMHDQLLARVRHAALGEHEILTELGRGGMATVYLAHDIQLDRKVAIKVMLPALLEGDDMVERFRLEARTAAQLSHPHIIPIYAVRASEGLVYFVMKFVEGRPLDAIVRELGQLPVPMVRSILSKVGDALGYAHRRGVVHRDIKPANLMIDVEGLPIVTDFGIAKVADSRGLTMTGAMMGTPTYMSPEQCSAGEITGASDQYSLGVVAYQMLGGRVPFEGETLVGLLYKHCHEPPAPLLAARPDCPPALAAAVMRMLEKDPAHRFPTMEAAVEAIGAVTLAYDDPIRTQLVGLARRGGNAEVLRRVSTPSSPVPLRRPRAPSAAASVAAPTLPRAGETGPPSAAPPEPKKRPLVAYASAAALVLALSAVTWWKPWAAAPPPASGEAPATAEGPPAPADPQTTTPLGTPAGTPPNAPAEPVVTPPVAAAPVGIRLAVSRTTFTVGETAVLRGSPIDAGGAELSTPAVRWSSSAPSRATITPSGALSAVAPGEATITARAGNVSQSLVVRVEAPRAAGLTVTGARALEVGGSVRLAATPVDAAGRPLASTEVSWRSSEQAVATVDDGLVRAVAPGTAVITATADGRDESVTIRVNAPEVTAAPASPPPPAARPEPVADPRAEIEGLIQRYARALERKQIAEVRAAYPGITAEQERTLLTLDQLKVTLTLGALNVSGNQATGVVSGRYEFYSRENRRTEVLPPVQLNLTLERGPSGWQIRSMTDVR